jgi:hypothetical protein
MKKTGIRIIQGGLLLLAFIFFADNLIWAQETSAVQVRMVVKVDDRDKAAENLVQHAEKIKGYFLKKAKHEVVLDIPAQRFKALLATAGQLGQVIDRHWQRQDLGEDILKMEAALKAKIEVQGQYLALLSQADIEAALYVEKELIKLAAEIETLKGRLRHLRHRISFARVEVLFDFRDRTAPVKDGRSSFAWLNTMNLSDLLKDF